ncbi:hypothetical protein L2E82_10401 [Cichorium intybus]|uniref:Uncharacterized protein n=1 Tax=Cichorium intybus TaxID=13427 RepID=A0ACB9GAI3_CICIN|nr:hypothetical protein L2E82_10401 [Cichorium intybus]
MDYITSNVETIISYDLEAETYELKFTSRLCIDNAKRIGNSMLQNALLSWTKLMCSIRSPKVISRIGNWEIEYRTEIDLNPCLVSENILLDEGSYDHLSMDRTDWVRVRQQFLGNCRTLVLLASRTRFKASSKEILPQMKVTSKQGGDKTAESLERMKLA